MVVGSNPVAASHVSGQNLLKNSRPAERLSYKQPSVDEDVGRLLNEESEQDSGTNSEWRAFSNQRETTS